MSPNHDVGMPVRFGITCEPNIYTADTDDVIGEHCRPPTPRLPEALVCSMKCKGKCNTAIQDYGGMQKYVSYVHTYIHESHHEWCHQLK